MKNEKLKALQAELDVQKWNDSQSSGVDACGSYDYCAKCDKTVEYPCAVAKTAAKKSTRKPCAKKSAKATAEKTVATENEKPVVDKVVRARKPRAKKAE